MTIGTSLVLIAVGAILRWAVTAHASWIDLRLAGLVLFLVGLVGLALSCLYTFRRANDRTHRWSDRADAPPPPAV
jgi:hypothetical protein